MAATIIDGKAVAKDVRTEVAAGVQDFVSKHGFPPGLAVVIVGDDPASRVYVDSKKKACHALGIYSEEHALPATTTQEELLSLIRRLNEDPRIHGILVQLPLPDHLDEGRVLEAIDPRKDVDGFHPVNVGKLLVGAECFVPCTPAGILELIKRTGVDLKGKRAVVVGRSNIVGKPVAVLLLAEHATVTVCHSRTRDLPGVCREADILVVAVGKPEMVDASYIKPGAVVIDVGVNEVGTSEGGKRKLVGDVKFDSASEVAGSITPVPGGVGPMTIAMLMKNTLIAAERAVR
ncbi:MAG: bifunctional methylenetetrahydrofolate dehydrogenase/methenyltetrahydrofolate cyclohydrolase FolD [Firmicutes bacterium]|nr:bifunctional methylenetetrahydrofolate dehydrogenase/methenyltetrahydrofolate cyclohydrolase FolD [Bacillota bacterium]MDH7496645.1 bifunctional methylenetetrahydrofolate dehydrogenase/methenyltetrahydrofolate cyclohydrolase FolD [Bacillota bacterium]